MLVNVSGEKARVLIGTSGWSYDHWEGVFYPTKLPQQDRLRYYAQQFSSVEINNSFYQLPDVATLRTWRDTVPAGFVFCVKGNRYITHMKKLKDPEQSVSALLGRIRVLDDKLGPILFQLPPHWRCNTARLASFLEGLSSEFRYAFEFRDQTWLNEEVLALLTRHNAAFCIYDFDRFLSPKEITADFVYVRLHGPDGPYQGSYDAHTLSDWAEALRNWSRPGRDIHCYFDNDHNGYAAKNARRLLSMVPGSAGRR